MIDKIKKKLRIDFSKNTKFIFYMRGLGIALCPRFLYAKNLQQAYDNLNQEEQNYVNNRVNYYCKIDAPFVLDDTIKNIYAFIKEEKKRTYYFDLLEHVKHFNYKNKISYIFGDVVTVPDAPSIVKSRPVNDDNKNSILINLDKVRHFIFVNDTIKFEDKKDLLIWRGKVHQEHRIEFFKKCFKSKYCDIGQINTNKTGDKEWEKEKLSLKEHLTYKFILAIEGNDVASNLKWIMSSNSLVLMVKPKFETWFMEGLLKENYHYVLIQDDYSDLEEKIRYYSTHISEAKKIIENANNYIEQFKNTKFESIISFMVLKKYFSLLE